ncbi:MAG: hypothetical protein Q8903_09355 [Bacteroidota bacterium]|nr:hypothetical protein [Bacteroidota bacterium]
MVISIRKGSNIGKIKKLLICVQKKKSAIVNRERFIESVYHLSFYGNILDKINYTKKDFTSDFSEDQLKIITFSIQWNILIITQSLTDELNKFLFNYKPDNPSLKKRIKAYKNIINPALKEIKKWTDIKVFRNNVLAHNGRDYHGRSVILSTEFENYDIPIYHRDFLVLFQLLKFITEKSGEIFFEEKQEAEEIMNGLVTNNMEIHKKKEDISKTINKINTIISEMNKRAANYNLC